MASAAEFSRGELLALYPVLASLAHDEMAAICRPDATAMIPEGVQLFAEKQACRGFPLLIAGSMPARPHELHGARHCRNPAAHTHATYHIV